MKWLYKLEYKYGRYAIGNLILYILGAQLVVFLMDMMFNFGVSNLLMLDIGRAVGQWQLWRFITFIFVPTNYSPFWIIISLMFYYFVGQSLENAWGAFMFNAFYFIGMLGIILGAVISYFITGFGYGTSEYLNTSMFLAFAILYPETPLRLYFVFSVKAKYLGILSGVLLIVNLITAIVYKQWYLVFSIIASLLNLILFFWNDASTRIRSYLKYRKTRQNYRNQSNEWERNRKNQDRR